MITATGVGMIDGTQRLFQLLCSRDVSRVLEGSFFGSLSFTMHPPACTLWQRHGINPGGWEIFINKILNIPDRAFKGDVSVRLGFLTLRAAYKLTFL